MLTKEYDRMLLTITLFYYLLTVGKKAKNKIEI